MNNEILLNKIYLFFSLLQGNLSRHIKNDGNVRYIKCNYEISYKEKSQWQDTFWHACNYIHVDFDWQRKKHTEFVLQFSISWQYLASKLQKVQEFQSGIYHQILSGYSISSSWNCL